VRGWAVAAAVLAAVAVFASLCAAPSPEGPPSRPTPESPGAPRAAAPDTPPSRPEPSTRAVPSPPQVPPVAKESPSVSAPNNPPPSPPAVKKPTRSAPVFSSKPLKNGVLGVCAAGAIGCPGAQVTPTREACPPAAVKAMDARGLEQLNSTFINVDASQPHLSPNKCREAGRWRTDLRECVATVGDGKIEGIVETGTRSVLE